MWETKKYVAFAAACVVIASCAIAGMWFADKNKKRDEARQALERAKGKEELEAVKQSTLCRNGMVKITIAHSNESATGAPEIAVAGETLDLQTLNLQIHTIEGGFAVVDINAGKVIATCSAPH